MALGSFVRDRLDQLVAGKFAPATSYQVVAYKAGAQVKGNQTGTVIAVSKGNYFPSAGGVKLFVMRRSGGLWAMVASSVRSVSSAAAGSVTISTSLTVLDGDYLVNIGSDSAGAGTNPVFDGSSASVYSTGDLTAGAIAQSKVSPNDQGEYQWYSSDGPLWHLVVSGTTPVELKVSGLADRLATEDANGFGVFIHPGGQNADFPGVFGASQNWGHGISFNKPSNISGSNAMHFFRDGILVWAIGEDFFTGAQSYFAILSNKAYGGSGSWASGDFVAISWGGAESSLAGNVPRVAGQPGVDGPKFVFNGVYVPASDPQTYSGVFQYSFNCPTLQTGSFGGVGIHAAIFQSAHYGTGTLVDFDSGGVQINASGGRYQLTLINESLTVNKRTAAIAAGRGGATGFVFGVDLGATDVQSWSIYDLAAAATRFWIAPDGKTGINTPLPSQMFDVELGQNALTGMQVNNNTSDTAAGAACYVGASGGYATLFMFSPAYTVDATLANDAFLVTQGTGKMLHLGTANTKRVSILDTGLGVGIGIDPPTRPLDVLGNVKLTGNLERSVTAAVTASTTHTQGGATALTADINNVSVCANVDDAVKLPSAVAGMTVVVINNGAQQLRIWPASGDNLGTGVDTVRAALAAGSNARFTSYDATNWEEI